MIRFSRNFGHQPAVSAGLSYCRGDLAVIIDADLQYFPEVIPEMIELLLSTNPTWCTGCAKPVKGSQPSSY